MQSEEKEAEPGNDSMRALDENLIDAINKTMEKHQLSPGEIVGVFRSIEFRLFIADSY